ncbi:MAG: HPr family phosphocarrier protein [Synergistaceae bacterium]|nr:HPr family phosphocarrier protein [Synergistaceae bacterium]MCD8163213.1 HPr family phosphocarrier protein [Synergistaceae bacterium]
MKEFSYVITDPAGIHARPAGLLVKEAMKFTSSIKIAKGEKSGDLKRIFSVMGLGAKCGEKVTLKVEGPDEEAAAAAVEAFLKANM